MFDQNGVFQSSGPIWSCIRATASTIAF
jgi:hypothetical protein